MKALIFARVSTGKQKTDRQVAELTKLCKDKKWELVETITEYISGATKNQHRAEVQWMLELAASGAIEKVVVTEISRLGKKLKESIDIIEQLSKLKVSIYIQNIGMETLLDNLKENFMFKPILVTLMSFAEAERELTRERISSGMAERKRQGKVFGRQLGYRKSDAKLLKEYSGVCRDLAGGISIRKIAAIYSISVNTVQKVKQAAINQGLLDNKIKQKEVSIS